MSAKHGGSWYAAMRAARGARGAHRRRVKGDRAFRRLLKRLPDAVREEMLDTMDQAGGTILALERGDAPHRSGTIAAALSKRLLRGSMRLKVGLIGRPLNRRLFWGRIVEKGRKAQIAQATRTTKSGKVSSYPINVRAMRPRPFVYGMRAIAMRNNLGGKLTGIWERALARASQGISDQ